MNDEYHGGKEEDSDSSVGTKYSGKSAKHSRKKNSGLRPSLFKKSDNSVPSTFKPPRGIGGSMVVENDLFLFEETNENKNKVVKHPATSMLGSGDAKERDDE